MDLRLSPTEAALASELDAWLSIEFDFDRLLKRLKTPASRDTEIWRALVSAGWIARALPRRDALQQSVIDAAIIAEAFGRAMIVEPFFRSGFVAANLLLEAAPADQADALIAAIAQDQARFACALYEPEGRHRLDHVATTAKPSREGWALTGRKGMVLDGADADHLLVTARTPQGLGLFLVRGVEGQHRQAFHTADDFSAADIRFTDAPASLLAVGEVVQAAVERGVDRAIVALGADVVGAASAALDETARYAGERKQFKRTISSFQVVSHRLARMFVELEVLRGGLNHALSTADGTAAERAMAASGLKHLIGESGRFVANQGVQLHGGVGTVHEFKVSHCFKRIMVGDILFGNGEHHLDRYAGMLT